MGDKNKTQPSHADVGAFLEAVTPPVRAADGRLLQAMMERISGAPAVLWGPSIVGFGQYAYRYDSGRTGVAPRIAFAPRKANMVVYQMTGFDGAQALLGRLGPHKTGASCLYLGPLSRVDQAVLEQLIAAGWAEMARRYPSET